MEAALTIWKDQNPPFPWPSNMVPWEDKEEPSDRAMHDVGEIGRRIEIMLGRQGKIPRDRKVRESAYARAEAAINQLGPDLFPLVASAEEPLSGSRLITASGSTSLRTERYELNGVVDVLTHVQLTHCAGTNVFRSALESGVANLPPEFEVIVDYKGARRPPSGGSGISAGYWEQHSWQVATYGWLRRRRTSSPVVAGILIYINELAPSQGDIQKLKYEIARSLTDELPVADGQDARNLSRWSPGAATNNLLSIEYRLRRAIRVVRIDERAINTALDAFDQTVLQIESQIAEEARTADISVAWRPTCGEKETCDACDFRSFCPKPAGATSTASPLTPDAP
jgi:hypothetical protein